MPLLSLRFFILLIGMLAAPTVAEFGLLLRNSDYRGKADLGHVIAAAREARGRDPDGYRAEFVRLAETVRGIGLARKDGAH